MSRKVCIVYLLFLLNSIVNANIVLKTNHAFSFLPFNKAVDSVLKKEQANLEDELENSKDVFPYISMFYKREYNYNELIFPNFVLYDSTNSYSFNIPRLKDDISTKLTSDINFDEDSDGDGILNDIDLDDDNDGILDAIESPSCYYDIKEANKAISITSTFNGAVGDPPAGQDIPLLYNGIYNDGPVAVAFNFAASQTATPGRVIFNIEYPTSFVMSSMSVVQVANGMSNSGFGQVFGSNDGINYTAISSGVRLNATAVRFPITTTDPYKYYQIRYIGTTAAGNGTNTTIGTVRIHEIISVVSGNVPYIASAHPKPGGCSEDIDEDGIPNHLDLDSDGDGCFDAYEGGATTNPGTSVINGSYGTNGFADSLETSVDNGIINYTTSYKEYATSANQKLCLDTDGDAIPDLIDLDDDNDGILDAVESPSCYYNIFESNKVLSIKSSFDGDVGDPLGGQEIPLLYNGISNDGNLASAFNFAPSQIATTGSVIFSVEYQGSFVMSLMSIIQAGNGVSNLGYGQVFGSKDGINYTAISSGIRLNTTAVRFPINTTNPYKYYQVRYIGTAAAGNETNGLLGVTQIHEITSVVSGSVPYVASANPKAEPCIEDADSDGVPNNLDLDSDGDGCFDAYEGGATTNPSTSIIAAPYGVNGLANSLETGVDNGIINYRSTYRDYAIYRYVSLCLDSDSDGVHDVIDIDDDNDGVLDGEESTSCFYNIFEANRPSSLSSSFDGAIGDPSSGENIPLLYDEIDDNGGVATAYNFEAGQMATPGSVIFNIEYSTSFVMRSMNVIQAGNAISNTGFGQVFASKDGIEYTAISTGVRLNTANINFPITTTDSFKYYQIRYIGTIAAGNLVNSVLGSGSIHEIRSALSVTVPYIVSEHPKKEVCLEDADGDGIPNHLDLDSDGDGCSDASESGTVTNFSDSTVAGPFGVNGFADSLETSTDSSVINYKSTYYNYALLASLKYCEDSDGDGVQDPDDLDKDNDGILDRDEQGFCNVLNRNMRIGYLNTSPGNLGVVSNLLTNPLNFGVNGVYRKVTGVTMVSFPNVASITEANLLAEEIDIFYVGSTTDDSLNALTGSSKVSSSVNTVLSEWAKANNKGIFMIQNNAVDYGFRTVNNNTNPNKPEGTLGRIAYTDGYWPTTQLQQSGSVQMTIMSTTRSFDILMVDANLRPVVVADREYNLFIFPDATIYNTYSSMNIPSNDDQRSIASTWAYVFDRFISRMSDVCDTIDTDEDGVPDYLDIDSDNDGCADALEGSAGLPPSSLVLASSGLSAGEGSNVNQNLCADGSCVNEDGIPLVALPSQAIGTSRDPDMRATSCVDATCYKPSAVSTGVVLDTNIGISSLSRKHSTNSDDWPMARKGAWLAIESKDKGFVLNRIPTTAQLEAIPNPIEGMMVYDEEAECIKIYTTTDNINFSWRCFNIQSCPD